MYCIWRRRRLVAGDALRLEHRRAAGRPAARARRAALAAASTSAAPSVCSSSTCLLFLRLADEFRRLHRAAMIARHAEATTASRYAPAQLRGVRAGGARRARSAPARAPASARSPRATACRSRCARASPTPSSTTATRASASRCISASGRRRAAATPAPRISPRAALEQTVEAAAAIARQTAVDDCAGPPEPGELRARRSPTWTSSIPGTSAPRRRSASRGACERAAFALSPKISNSEGATRLGAALAVRVRQQPGLHAAASRARATTLSLLGDRRGARPDAARRLVQRRARAGQARRARGAGPLRRRARAGAPGRAQDRHPPGAGAVRGAGRGRADRLSSSSAASGGSLYRKTSFLLDSLGKQVFRQRRAASRSGRTSRARSPARPSTRRAWRRARAPWCATACWRAISSAATRRASSACKSTGSAGGNHNLVVRVRAGPDFRGMLKQMRRGPAGHRDARPGHEPGHRRLLARRRGLLGGERRDRAIRWRRSPSPATCKDMFRGIAAVGARRRWCAAPTAAARSWSTT